MAKDIEIKCIDCPYCSNVECHGHGDYWRSCLLLQQQSKFLSKVFNLDDAFCHIVPINSGDLFINVLNDDSSCKFFKIKDYH